MAIQTGGFKINFIPRYTPVDPTLVALNPGNFLSGAEQAIQAGRNATNTMSLMKTAPSRAEADIAANKAASATAPAKANYEVQNYNTLASLLGPQSNLSLAQIGADLQNVPKVGAATGAEAEARSANANISSATAPNRLQSALASTAGEAARAPSQEELKDRQLQLQKLATEYQGAIDPQVFALKLKDIQDQAQNGSTESFNRAAIKAKIDLDKAQGEYMHDHGLFMLGQGRQTGHPVDPAMEAERYAQAINRINSMQVGQNKEDTLGKYEAETYDENGKVAQGGGVLGLFTHPMPKNQAAEALLKQRRQLEGALNSATLQMVHGYPNPAASPQSSSAATQPLQFGNEAEAVRAEAGGLLQKGQRVIIGGVSGTWQ